MPRRMLGRLLDIKWDDRWRCIAVLTGSLDPKTGNGAVSLFSTSGKLLSSYLLGGSCEPTSRLFRIGRSLCFLAHSPSQPSSECLVALQTPAEPPLWSLLPAGLDYDASVENGRTRARRRALVATALEPPQVATITRDGRAVSVPNGPDVWWAFPVLVGRVDWPELAFSDTFRTVAVAGDRLVVAKRSPTGWRTLDIGRAIGPKLRARRHASAIRGCSVWTDDRIAVFGITYETAGGVTLYATFTVDIAKAEPKVLKLMDGAYAPPTPVLRSRADANGGR